MKKLLITLLAALVVGGIVSAQAFPDIPVGHWAGDAVEEIADLGIVIGFPDGTFRGNEAFTRYQMALVISRLLAVIDARVDADLAGLRGSLQGVAADLAAQGVRLSAAESAIAAISDDVAANTSAISGLTSDVAANSAAIGALAGDLADQAAALGALSGDVEANTAAIGALAGDVADQAAAIGAVAGDLAAQAARIGALEGDVDANTAAVGALAADVAAQADAIGAMAADVAAQAAGLAAVSGEVDANAAAIAGLAADVAAIKAAVDQLAGLAAQVDANAAAIAGLAADVAAIKAAVDQLAGLVGEVDANAAAIAGLAAEVEASKAAIGSLAGDLADQAAAIGDVAGDLAAQAARIDALHGEVDANKAAISGLAGDVAAQADAIGALSGDVAAQAAGLAALAAEVDANKAAISGLAGDVAANAAAISGLAGDVAANSAAIGALSSDVAANAAGLAANAAGVAANAARIDALEAALADLPPIVDEAVVRDLQNQLASARVAIDTAQAQAEAADARAAGAYDLALQGLAAADANAAEIAALNQVVQLLSERVEALDVPIEFPPPPDLSGIDRNAGDIANIREFLILLRREQVELRVRVSALEEADVATAESIADLQARVAALEARPTLEFSGSIALTYQVGRLIGDEFDIDRAYGLNAARGIGASAFSTGTTDVGGDGTRGNQVGERAQETADIKQQTGEVKAALTLNVTGGNVFDGKGSPRGLNSFSVVVEIDVKKGFVADDSSFTTGFEGYIFRVKSFKSTFAPIGAQPITFAFGEEVSVGFTNYVFVADKLNGYVATVSAPDFLAFLNPGLTAAYFSDKADGYWRGIRGTMAPSFGDAITLSGGVHFAQAASLAGDKDNVLLDNITTTVWGLDGEIGLLGLVDLAFEYANSSTYDQAADAVIDEGTVLWVTADAGIPLGFLDIGVGGNYRALDLAFDGIGKTGDSPFERGQTGFGVEASIGLDILGGIDITGFFDSYTSELPAPPPPDWPANVGYGAEASIGLFLGIALEGFYEIATVDGAVADGSQDVREVDAGYSLLDGDYQTKFGFGVSWKLEDVLVFSELNLRGGYERSRVDYTRERIHASGDAKLEIWIVTLTPYGGFERVTDSVAGTNDFTEYVFGSGLTTQPFALPLAGDLSLQGAANYRSATYTDARDFTATEFQWSVGLTFEEFLLPYSTLSARVGSWTGTNMTTALSTLNDGISGGRTVKDVDRGGLSESVFGYEVTWNYYDLRFAYGVYENTRDGVGSSAQAFSIKYTVTF